MDAFESTLAERVRAAGLVAPEGLEDCRKLQADFASRGLTLYLSEILIDRGLVEIDDLVNLMDAADSDSAAELRALSDLTESERIAVGEILLASPILTAPQIAECLRLHEDLVAAGFDAEFGQVLVRRGYLQPHTLEMYVAMKERAHEARKQVDPFADPELSLADKLFAALSIHQGFIRRSQYESATRIRARILEIGLDVSVENVLRKSEMIASAEATLVAEMRDARLSSIGESHEDLPDLALPRRRRLRLGDLLVRRGLLDRSQLRECLDLQAAILNAGIEISLSEVAVRKGMIGRDDVETILALQRELAREEDPGWWVRRGTKAALLLMAAGLLLWGWKAWQDHKRQVEEQTLLSSLESEYSKRNLDRRMDAMLRQRERREAQFGDEALARPGGLDRASSGGGPRAGSDAHDSRAQVRFVEAEGRPVVRIEVEVDVGRLPEGELVQANLASIRYPEIDLFTERVVVRHGGVSIDFGPIEPLVPDRYWLDLYRLASPTREDRIPIDLGNPRSTVAAEFERSTAQVLASLESGEAPQGNFDVCSAGDRTFRPPPFLETRTRIARLLSEEPPMAPADLAELRIVFEHERILWSDPASWTEQLSNLLERLATTQENAAIPPGSELALAEAVARFVLLGDDTALFHRWVRDTRLALPAGSGELFVMARERLLGRASPGITAQLQLEGIAARRLAESNQEAIRLLTDPELPDLERRTRALEIRTQIAAWARLAEDLPELAEPDFDSRACELSEVLARMLVPLDPESTARLAERLRRLLP